MKEIQVLELWMHQQKVELVERKTFFSTHCAALNYFYLISYFFTTFEA